MNHNEEHKHGHSHDLNIKKIDRLSPTRVRLTVEFSAENVANHEKATTNRYANAAKIPGFRPGKAPLKMIKEKYKEEIRRDVVSHLLEAGLSEAIQKANLMPVNRPSVKMGEFGEGKAFEFHAEFEVEPEIELKKYKGIPLKSVKLEVEEEEITKTLDHLRERFSSLEPAPAAKAEKGHFGVVEVSYELKSDATKKDTPQTYTVELGMEKLLPALDKALMEMEVGESRQVEEKFPEEYSDKTLSGKDAVFSLKLVELKKKVLPELNDAFANQIKEGTTLEALKKEVSDSIRKGKEEDSQRSQRQEIVDFLVKQNAFEVPNSMVESQAGSLLQWMEQDLKRRGMATSSLKSEELESVKKRAEHMVRSSLLLKEVAIKEKISLDEQRFQAKIDVIASQLDRSVEDAKKYLAGKGMIERLRDEVLTDQVFEFLLANAEFQSK